MILNFPGGARPDERTRLGKKPIEYIKTCSAVCIEAAGDAAAYVEKGSTVVRGGLIGESLKTPVFSPIAGKFNGVLEIDGRRYFAVMNNGEKGEEVPFAPETRALTEMSLADISESARKLGIIDTRSGVPLWVLLNATKGNMRRLVVDCTEPDAASAINYRLCVEKSRSLVGGAKVLLKATGALKCVFALEHYRKAAFDALMQYAGDEKLFAMAEMDEKYPYSDISIMYALYLKSLENGEAPIDYGVCIVGAEAVAALYDAMVSGMPWVDRYASVCGDGLDRGGNLCVPRGMLLQDIVKLCGGIRKKCIMVENSLISGSAAGGALADTARALIAACPEKKVQTQCISCGRCASACPVRLVPNEILAGKNPRLRKYCVSCGACEYVCPSGIPLLSLIQRTKKVEERNSDAPEVMV